MADPLLVPALADDPACIAWAAGAARMSALDLTPVLTCLVDAAAHDVLPYLAQQFHIMGNEGWRWAETDTQRRELIKAAVELHRYKGTPWSIKRAFQALGYSINLVEHPAGAHWAEFDAQIDVSERGASPDMYDTAEALLDEWKPERCHLRTLALVVGSHGTEYVGAGLMSGEHTTVYPFQIASRTVSGGTPMAAAAMHGAEVVTIFPQG